MIRAHDIQVSSSTPQMSPRSMLYVCTPISGTSIDAHAELAEAHGYRRCFVVSEVLCTFTPCMSALVLIPRDEPTCHAWMHPRKRCGWSRDISAETLCVLYGDELWDLITTQGGRGERPGAFLSILVVHGWKEYLAISLIFRRRIGPSNSVQ